MQGGMAPRPKPRIYLGSWTVSDHKTHPDPHVPEPVLHCASTPTTWSCRRTHHAVPPPRHVRARRAPPFYLRVIGLPGVATAALGLPILLIQVPLLADSPIRNKVIGDSFPSSTNATNRHNDRASLTPRRALLTPHRLEFGDCSLEYFRCSVKGDIGPR